MERRLAAILAACEFGSVIGNRESIPTLGASSQNGTISINNVVDPVKGIQMHSVKHRRANLFN